MDTKYGYRNEQGTNNSEHQGWAWIQSRYRNGNGQTTGNIMVGHGYKVGTGTGKGQTTGSIRVGHGYKLVLGHGKTQAGGRGYKREKRQPARDINNLKRHKTLSANSEYKLQLQLTG